MQEDHDLADDLLVSPARGDFSGANFPDPIDLSQPRGRLLNDIEHGGTEGLDQSTGVHRTNTLDHSGAEVALDAGQRVRWRNPDEDRLELSAVLAIRDPCARCRGVLAWRYGRGVPDQGDELTLALALQPQDAEAAIGIVERDALDE